MIKVIHGFENYSITPSGDIFSIKTNKLKTQCYGAGGYLIVQLWKSNKGYTKLVHRLVLEAFVGPCPDGMECCHNNSICTDNRLDNLRWDTPKNNHQDSINAHTHASLLRGEKSGGAKITDTQVASIFSLRNNSKWYQKDIAKLLGISQSQVSRILNKISRA